MSLIFCIQILDYGNCRPIIARQRQTSVNYSGFYKSCCSYRNLAKFRFATFEPDKSHHSDAPACPAFCPLRCSSEHMQALDLDDYIIGNLRVNPQWFILGFISRMIRSDCRLLVSCSILWIVKP